jgi:3-methyladenine DNA glycosylase/8-oxoguanine DNA glycosylase
VRSLVELRVEVQPASPFRLPQRCGMDGLLRRRGAGLVRLLHHEGQPVLVRVEHATTRRVCFHARSPSSAAAAYGIERMRFALAVDEDLRPFLRAFKHDPLIGRSLRTRPWLRVTRRPEPFEALTWAICEQLIEYERAAAIQRRVVARLGRRWPHDDGAAAGAGARSLRDAPAANVLAGTSPALLQSLDLAASRAITLVRAAREVARGRIDLHNADHERAWRRLRAIPGIGRWTVEMLAVTGHGRHDQLPAGDLGLLKFVGRLLSGGDPRARAEERDVRELFAPYGCWTALAAAHAWGGN